MIKRCCMGILLMLPATTWAQPEFDFRLLSNFNLPAILYLEHNLKEGDISLKIAFQNLALWDSFEVLRAPYIDVVYAAKGGALVAVGESEEACYVFGVDFLNSRTETIFARPMPNPWVGKRHREWLRTEVPASAILLAYEPPEKDHLLIYRYSYAQSKVEVTEVSKSLFEEGLNKNTRMKIAPDNQHIVYATTPKEIIGQPNTYESTLKVIHFSNMTVTDATKSVTTHVTGGQDAAWPVFDFQSSTYVHYFTAEPSPTAPATRSKMTYKAVEVELGTNSEIFTATLPVPHSMGGLYRHPETYHMIYTHNTNPPVRYVADHDGSRSLLIHPDESFHLEKFDLNTRITADSITIFDFPSPLPYLKSAHRSYFDNYVFTLGNNNEEDPEFFTWFYDPRGHLYPVTWTSNPVTLIGVIEYRDPLKKKI